MKKRYFEYLGVAIGIILLTFIFNRIIVSEVLFPIAKNNEWIGYYGSVLSGIITLLGVMLTIRYYKNKDEKAERLKIRPYIRLNTDEINATESRKNKVNFYQNSKKYNDNERNIQFSMQNIGSGPSISISLVEFVGQKTFDKNAIKFHLIEKEKIYCCICYEKEMMSMNFN